MATPTINNLTLPGNRILVLLDEDSQTTGVVSHRSSQGGGLFIGAYNPIVESAHVLFVKEMATEVKVDGVEYMAMHINAIVGVIPE